MPPFWKRFTRADWIVMTIVVVSFALMFWGSHE
jgi:hypothetical protein